MTEKRIRISRGRLHTVSLQSYTTLMTTNFLNRISWPFFGVKPSEDVQL